MLRGPHPRLAETIIRVNKLQLTSCNGKSLYVPARPGIFKSVSLGPGDVTSALLSLSAPFPASLFNGSIFDQKKACSYCALR